MHSYNNYFRSTGYSEVIVVVGGCERVGGFNLPYTECYDPVTGEWKSLAKLPEFTKSEYAVCALRNDILVSGGRINSRDVWIYNSQLNIWIRVASLNKGRWRHKMAVLLGKVRETTFCYYCWYLSRINTTDESFILLTLWVFWTQLVFPFISNLST